MSTPARPVVIAVDGPAASGKGTVARKLAARLGYAYLDTGALYRTIALETLKRGGNPEKLADIRPVLGVIAGIPADVLQANPDLRTSAVAEAASKVSAIPEVRQAVRAYQEVFMKNPPNAAPGVVLDGRDIGTVVCPDADLKFYVTADAEERARRRFNDLKDGQPGLAYETVLADINRRDDHDMHRDISPLRPAADAYVIDNTHMLPGEALEEAVRIAAQKLTPPPPPGASKFSAPRNNGPRL